jgi:short-subunit dehydrogenase
MKNARPANSKSHRSSTSAVSRSTREIEDQVVVISGADRGAGLEVAEKIAEQGACVVLSGRDSRALSKVAKRMKKSGCEVECVDFADSSLDAGEIRETATSLYGRIDAWVHIVDAPGGESAPRSVYSANGSLLQGEVEEEKREFDRCFWETRIACREAIEGMRDGGTLVVVDTSASAFPIGMHAICSHSVETYFQSLREEVERIGIPIEFRKLGAEEGQAGADSIIHCLSSEQSLSEEVEQKDPESSSVYSKISEHPWLTLAAVGAGVASVVIAKTLRASASVVGASVGGGRAEKDSVRKAFDPVIESSKSSGERRFEEGQKEKTGAADQRADQRAEKADQRTFGEADDSGSSLRH